MRVCWKCKRKYDLPGVTDANFCPFCGACQEVTSDLVHAAATNDQNAMAQLYMMSYGLVYATVRSIIKNEDDVEDIMQDTYVSAFQRLDTLNNPASFYGWMQTSARNKALNFAKKSGKTIAFSQMESDDDDNRSFEIPDETYETPDIPLEQQEVNTLVNEMLDSLKDDIRIPLIMYYYNEMDIKEIASELGVSESTIKNRLYYGRKQLKTKAEETEKKGFSLRGLAPIPFLLMLLRNAEIQASAATPNVETLSSISSAVSAAGTSVSSSAVSGAAKGAKAGREAARASKTTAKSGASRAAKTATKKGIQTLRGKIIAGAVATAAVGGTGAVVVYNATTINPMDYMVVTFEGDDGEGTAYVSFDYEAFEAYRYKKEKTLEDQEDTYKMESILKSTLEYSLNKEIHLSNGDKVTLKIQYDADAFDEFGYNLGGWKSSRYTVEGLTVYTYPQSFDDLSEEQINNFKETSFERLREYDDQWISSVSILNVEDLAAIGMSLKYDEASEATFLYAIYSQTSYTTDGQLDPTEQIIVLEFTEAYFVDDDFTYGKCSMIAEDTIASISTGNWFNPTLSVMSQLDLSEYTQNGTFDDIYYEYISFDTEKAEDTEP